MRTLSKLGPYIFTVVVVAVVIVVLGAMISWSNGLNKPATEEELTQNMMGNSTPSPVAESPAATPAVEPVTPSVDPAAPVAPVTQEPEDNYFGGEDSMVASVEVMDDDIIITLKTAFEANATQTHAPYVLQEAIDNMTGSENAAQIDLVAVYSSDGVMVASDRIPVGKWQ